LKKKLQCDRQQKYDSFLFWVTWGSRLTLSIRAVQDSWSLALTQNFSWVFSVLVFGSSLGKFLVLESSNK